jgi:hypothetical protein
MVRKLLRFFHVMRCIEHDHPCSLSATTLSRMCAGTADQFTVGSSINHLWLSSAAGTNIYPPLHPTRELAYPSLGAIHQAESSPTPHPPAYAKQSRASHTFTPRSSFRAERSHTAQFLEAQPRTDRTPIGWLRIECPITRASPCQDAAV